jgi:hypothetical protein
LVSEPSKPTVEPDVAVAVLDELELAELADFGDEQPARPIAAAPTAAMPAPVRKLRRLMSCFS